MDKEKLWGIYVRKNPHWENKDVTFTPKGLKKFFNTTFEQGRREGAAPVKMPRQPRPSSDIQSVFGDIFKDR